MTVASVASRSASVRVPPVLSTMSDSVRLAVALVRVETSSLPVIVMVTSFAVPSALSTVKLSVSGVLLVFSPCTVGLSFLSV